MALTGDFIGVALVEPQNSSNENINGLIRQYLPKNKSMVDLTQQQCDRIADSLNDRPRKRYDYKTPREMYYGI